jgi:callose synthase
LQIIAAARDVQEKTEIYTPYNILPLDSAGASLPIMQFEEVFLIDLMLNLCVLLT